MPWPPTANSYWRRNGNRYFIAPKGVAYRKATIYLCKGLSSNFPITKRLKVTLHAFPPDKRRRDLDNICKCLLDSLQKANIYDDDSQIDMLIIIRNVSLESKVEVEIEEIGT